MKFSIFIFLILPNYIKPAEYNCNDLVSSSESELRRNLLCDYDKGVRANSGNGTINVNIGIKLIAIFYQDEVGTLTITAHLIMKWDDRRLTWEPSKYKGMDKINIGRDNIWMADFSVHNNKLGSSDDIIDGECIVSHVGGVVCTLLYQLAVPCYANIERWPYDSQNCIYVMGSWSRYGEELDFHLLDVSLVYDHKNLTDVNRPIYSNGDEWKLYQFRKRKHVFKFDEVPNTTYPTVQYLFALVRVSASHEIFILIPTLFMIAMNILLLLIDPECSERLMLLAINLFGHFNFMQQLQWYIPKNGGLCPKILIFYRDSLIITIYLLIHTTIMKILKVSDAIVPRFMETAADQVRGNPVSHLLVTKNLISQTDDMDVLVESNTSIGCPEHPSVNLSKTKTSSWLIIVKILDRLTMVIITIFYLCALILFVPEGYDGKINSDKLQIFNY